MKFSDKNEILTFLKTLSLSEELLGVRIGIVGSYSRDEQTDESDFDIVYSLQDKEKNMLNEIDFFIEGKLSSFDNEFDVLWVELLKEDDDKMDEYLVSIGAGTNEYSPFKEMMKDVIWVN